MTDPMLLSNSCTSMSLSALARIIYTMNVCYQLIQSHFVQELPAILITIQNQKYVINMPESFQRFVRQNYVRFPRASNMFFTKVNSNSMGGLIGFMLTLYSNENAWDTKLFFTPRLYDYFEEVRYQMGFKILAYSYIDWSGRCRRGMRSKDLVQKLLNQKDFPTWFHHLEKYLTDKISKKDINDAGACIKNGVFKDQNLEIIPFQTGKQTSQITNFICKPNCVPGKVIVEKVNEMKIPKNMIGKILQAGSFELPDGRVIFAKDIKQDDSPAPNFLIVHTDSLVSLRETLKHDILLKYLDNTNNKTQSVIHIIEDSSVLQTEQYNYFLKMFPQYTRHIIYGKGYKDNDELPHTYRHFKIVQQLAQQFPETVANIQQKYIIDWELYNKRCKYLKEIFPHQNVTMYKKFYEMTLAPVKKRGYNLVPSFEKQQPDILVESIDLGDIKNKKMKSQQIWNFQHCDPQVIFLGTASMMPNTFRNVSGIMVQMSKDNAIILDCGEGTYLQLLNHFGYEKVDDRVLSIRVIFITHIHSDHNLGILNLLAKRKKLCEAKGIKSDIFLIVPYNMAPWLYAYNEFIENLGVKCLFTQTVLQEKIEAQYGTMSKDERCFKMPTQVTETENYSTPKLGYILANYYKNQAEILQDFWGYLKEFGIQKFKPVHVIHCPQSYGIIIEHVSGVKISYSGDCRPTLGFIEQAANSTLMIHEATYDDDEVQNAKTNMHSTIQQAILSAMRSNSWRLALTHFSNRYKNAWGALTPEKYHADPVKQKYAKQNTIVCFDHLQMHLSECEYMPGTSRQAMGMLPWDRDESSK